MGAPAGNQNAKRAAEWRQAIKRALAHHSGKTYREGLDEVARKFVAAAIDGDSWAMKEIGDRMDGKPAQAVQVSGPEDGPIQHKVEFVVVNEAASPDSA